MSVYQTITNQTAQKTFTTHQYAYFDDVFTKDELKKIIEISTKISLVDGGIGDGDGDGGIGPRVSKINHQTLNENNKWIFDRLNQLIVNANMEFFDYDLIGYDSYQYSEYHMKDAGHYDYHVDIIFNGHNLDTDAIGIQTRKLSISLLLNEPEVDFEGGEFYINSGGHINPITKLKAGTAILFPSFLLHKVAPVTKGIRKSLVVWITGPKFR